MTARNQAAGKKPSRLWGVDSIRFLMALVVVLGHLPRLRELLPAAQYGSAYRLIDAANGLWVNGPAAVIVFFLISGLCIHFPQRDSLKIPNLSAFYSRRIIRISLPMAVGMVLLTLIGEHLTLLDVSIYWSLVCEIIYYLLYPFLLTLRRSMPWSRIVLISFVMAFCVVLTNPAAGNYPSYTNLLNWIVGLPCWLLGCLLAERSDSAPAVSSGRVWALRAMALLGASASIILRWHLPHGLFHGLSIGMPWSLDAFSLIAFVWLGAELSWHKARQAPHFLEAAGAWSYSLYLVHPAAMLLATVLLAHLRGPAVLLPVSEVCVSLVCAYAFYRLVEMPSHLLAIACSRWLRDRMPPAARQEYDVKRA